MHHIKKFFSDTKRIFSLKIDLITLEIEYFLKVKETVANNFKMKKTSQKN